MDEFKRDFKGIWINRDIWLDKRINALDKVIFAEIDSLDVGEEGCYASNEYLAEFCQCTTTKVSTAISKLVALGYVDIIKFDGRKRYMKTLKNLKADFKKPKRQTLKNLKADFKNIKEIYIDNNKEYKINDIINIVDYLNQKTGAKYKATTSKTKSLITARFNEGFSVEDFKVVIDNKSQEWLGTDMEKYLRPETLFGNKFEGYLNQKNNSPKWFNKEVAKQEITEAEEQELDELLKEFR